MYTNWADIVDYEEQYGSDVLPWSTGSSTTDSETEDDGHPFEQAGTVENGANVHPGEPIGIRAVQSILMSATQMSLSHFHTAGMGTDGATTGAAPSAAEAMDSAYTASNTSMRFDASTDIQKVRKSIVGASLGSFVTTVGSSFTLLPEHENIWYEALGDPVPEGILRFYIDSNRMWDHGMTLRALAQRGFEDDCKWRVSPDFMGMIDVEVSGMHMSSWLSRMERLVCGTPRVLSCDVASSQPGGRYTAVTRGTDVLAVSRVSGVDKGTIVSNNVSEVEKAFGIEAAAGVLSELVGSHIVSDFMARTGTVLPFNKGSKEVQAKGLLTCMGFERPKDDIRRALASDDIPCTEKGMQVYESIITGIDPFTGFEVIT